MVVEGASPEVIQELLAAGADVNAKLEGGATALILMVAAGKLKGNPRGNPELAVKALTSSPA